MAGLASADSLIITDRHGRIRDRSDFAKAPSPVVGPSYGDWAGRDNIYASMPGGGMLNFDLSRLTLADYRNMRPHYQVNSSITVLSFMVHQLDWHIECERKDIATMIEDNMKEVWTRLIRAMSQSYWCGFSPTSIEYKNDGPNNRVLISKFKDLIPEECCVNWKLVDGWAPPGHLPPKFKEFDGIRQAGMPYPIPPENSLWYPLLMENGDYGGKKLLKPAFPAWYFSMLIHLFANRYFERFGEPTPIGRAPFEAEVEISPTQTVTGKQAMEDILMSLRSRGVVTLPSDRDPVTKEFDYSLDYLESQMRGADFERYLARLDEEISLGLFTPVLLIRTADVGSYNLGVSHLQMYLWMLNALAGDLKEYLDRYVIKRLKDYNFGPNAPEAQWIPRKLGKENVETFRAVLTEMIRNGVASVDLLELGQTLGITIEKETPPKPAPAPPAIFPPVDPTAPMAPPAPAVDPRIGRTRANSQQGTVRPLGQARATSRQISARLAQQITSHFKSNTFNASSNFDMGYRRRFTDALRAEGLENAEELSNEFYSRVESWLRDAASVGQDEYSDASEFRAVVDRLLDSEIERLESL